MSRIGAPIHNFKRKCHIKPYIVFLIPIFLIAFVIIGLEFYEEADDSFQNFSYPSDDNFHEILHAPDANNFTKLNTYDPRLINVVEVSNASSVKILVVVKSSLQNGVKRANIRATWGSILCQQSHRLLLYFALGESPRDDQNTTDIDNKIAAESRRHNDILQFNFVDAYHNNTYKVMAIMSHFVKFYTEVPYLLIVDDDFFVDVSILTVTITNKISQYEYDQYFGGHVWYHSTPQRTRWSKWFVTKQQYRFDYYPPYVNGGFILISSPMVRACSKLLPFLKYSSIDDVLLGILLFKLNVYPFHLKNVVNHRSGQYAGDLLACHGFSNDLLEFWRQKKSEKMC